jgi:hypothetical protein
LESLFGKKDEMRGHMLEVELNTSDPKVFDNIHDLFNKFKYLKLSLEYCGILTMLAKLGPQYVVYVSSFHYGRYLLG